MNIKEVKKHKEQLEIDITLQVHDLVEEFKKKTDLSPDSIYINMHKNYAFGCQAATFFVGKTQVNIEL